MVVSLLLKLFVFSRDQFACVFCGRAAPGVDLLLDQDLLSSRGGRDDVRNLHTACKECTDDEGIRTAQEYRNFLRAREEILLKLSRV